MAGANDSAAQTANMIVNLEKATGRSMPQWVQIAKGSGLSKHGEMVKYLQNEHGLTYGYANLVVHTANQSAAVTTDDRAALIDAQYAKGKEHLRPIYDRLVEVIAGFGGDVEFVPMKAYVSVRRGKQFACIGPATKSRFEVGIKLPKGTPATERLQEGGFNGMVSHLVKVTDPAELDAELFAWLKEAYDLA
ncbi:MAG: DUF4287 domain-containing protein [Anaerolineae bacterium]|nr:DUF4287 domain-containing protein [Anaerolineae bacterium]